MRHARAVDASAGSEQEIVDLVERSWLPRHCRGDRHAFAALLGAYRRPVYSYLIRWGCSQDVADDMFQDIFLKIHAAAATYQPSRPLKPWIFTIVVNTVRNNFRAQSVRNVVLHEADLSTVSKGGNPTQTDVAARRLVRWVECAITTLPAAQRDVLVLTTIDGMQHNEAAEILGLPVNTVKTHLRRARIALTKRLMDSADSTAAGGVHEHL